MIGRILRTLSFFFVIISLAAPTLSIAQDLDEESEFFDEPEGLEGEFEVPPAEEDIEEEFIVTPETERNYRNENRAGENIVEEDAVAIELDNEPMPLIEQQRKEVEYRYNAQPIKIYHPNAKKGLIRITKDKTYIYKIPASAQDRVASVRFGAYEPTKLQNPELSEDFLNLYENTSNPTILIDYEWDWLKGGAGIIGLKVGSGLYVATGHGAFESETNKDLTPKEKFMLFAFPNSASVTYRARFSDNQIIVPYVEGGVDAFLLMESRDDESFGFKFAGTPAAHGAGGLALNLNSFSDSSLLELDREYGINTIYVTVEFRTILALNKKFDVSGNIISGGVTVEF